MNISQQFFIERATVRRGMPERPVAGFVGGFSGGDESPDGDLAALPGVPREQFIGAMRGVASSVTVVTTDGPSGRHGATVSAFCSVSADPPSALVCLKTDSRIAQAVAGNRVFCINLLPADAQHIANRFAGCDDAGVADRFDGIDCDAADAAANGAASPAGPLLSGATVFVCRLGEHFAAGSHGIFVGEVVALRESAAEPLIYLDGGYHRAVANPPAEK